MKSILLIFLLFTLSVNAQWSNNPSVNTDVITGYNAFNPQSISDGVGGAIVIWQTFDGLYAQRISALGNKLWSPLGVPINNQYVTNPQILTDGSGGAFICWVDNRYGDDDIFLQKIDNNGSALWIANGIAVCSEPESYYQDSPVMCSDDSGGVYVAWRDQRNFNSDIYAQRINSLGNNKWTANGIAVCDELNDQISPQIASDGSNGAVIVWTDSRNSFSSGNDIFAQKIDFSGSAFWTANGESVCSELGNQSYAKIVNSGTNNVIVAWEDERGSNKDIYAQSILTYFNYLSVAWAYNGEIICSESADQYNAELVSNLNGEAFFCWVDERNGSANKDIFAQRINSSGQYVWTNNGVTICDEVNDQLDQEMISDGYSGAIITWTDARTSLVNSDVYAQRIDANGFIQWASNGIVLANASNDQLEPSVVILNPNNFFTAFTDKRTASDIYCQKFLIDGSLPLSAPASVDGIISPNEYGFQGSYFPGDGNVVWYMRMDTSFIYVGLSGYTNSSYAVEIYLSNSRVTPVNIIDNSYGSVIGTGYIVPSLPFRATYSIYVKPVYDEYRYFDGASSWGPSTSNGIIKSYNASNQVIEFVIPWSSLPDIEYIPRYGMNWLGFLSYETSGGGTLARVPRENPQGIYPDMSWYFDTGYASFGGGIIDLPFRNKCYTHVGVGILNFGALDVWNFTLNSPGIEIIRTSGDWNIGGTLLVNNGTLTFNSNNPVNVQTLVHRAGEIRFSSGSFDAPLNLQRIYRENLAGPLVMNAGHTTTFLGSTPFFSDKGSPIIELQNVILQSNTLDLYSDMTINQSLALNSGVIRTNGYRLILKFGVIVTGTGHINGVLEKYIPTSSSALGKGDGLDNFLVNFPIGTENGPSPVSIDFSSVSTGGTLSVQAVQTVHPNSVVPSESMKRYWKITKDNNLAFTTANITFNYRPQDFNTAFFEAADEDSMIVGKYDASWSYPSIFTRTPGGINDGGSITISGVTSFSDFTMFKLQLSANIRVFLEGPFSAGLMSTSLNTGGSIPLNQPYNTTPWNYNGTETAGSIPSGVVDWVLLELRSNTTTTVARRAAFLRSNGSLVDLDGTSNVSFPGVQAGNYYLVVYHRNHLPIMTANPVQVSNNPTLFDLSTGQGQAFGTNAMKDLGGGVYGLYTADTDGSGTVNASDRSNTWNQRNLSGYYGTDVDLSGTVNAADRSSVWNNRNISTQVPAPVSGPNSIELITGTDSD